MALRSAADLAWVAAALGGAALSLAAWGTTWWTTRSLGSLSTSQDGAQTGPSSSAPADDTGAPRTDWPSVSMLCPARDEEREVTASLRSWLDQGYPQLQVVAVDDRSSDATGEAIRALAAVDPRVVPVAVQTLPSGWLGKSHALHRAVAHATGDWLLFCDADVRLAPGALQAAIRHAEGRELDLLSALPTVDRAGFLLDAFWSCTGMLFAPGARPWAIPDPQSGAEFAAGAFVLIRRRAWERTPGMPWLALEVADDVGLCALVKRHGGRCAVVSGGGLVALQWYASPWDCAQKMQKNWFGILGRFSVPRTVALGAVFLGLGLFPLLALAAPSWPWAAVPVMGYLAGVLNARTYARWTGRSTRSAWWHGVGWWFTAAMVWRSAWVGWRVGGIVWRGQVFPSAALAAEQRVRL